jgi:hypothetical protein
MDRGASHEERSVPRETGYAFLEALAATVTPTTEAELATEYYEDHVMERAVLVELYDEDRVLLARISIRRGT